MAGGLAQDQTVKVKDGTPGTNGVMVWGDYGGGKGFEVFRDQGEVVTVGDVKPGATHSKVATFANGRAPGYAAAVWKNSGPRPTLEVENPPVVSIPVKVWVLCREKSCPATKLTTTESGDLMKLLIGVNVLFSRENAGVLLNLSDPGMFIDKKLEGTKRKYHDFNNKLGQVVDCDLYPELITGMLDRKSLNLYFVRSVQTQFGRGETCDSFTNVAVFGLGATAGLIAHEIGHNHYLWHTDEPRTEAAGKAEKQAHPTQEQFGDKTNIMHSLSTERRYFSEGEIYVMHFEKRSLRNWCPEKFCEPPTARVGASNCEAGSVVVVQRVCPPLNTVLRENLP